MFLQSRPTMSAKLQEEFSTVESIMRCEDFKSNFARRLSNRYISRSPVSSPKQDTVLKLCLLDNGSAEHLPDYVPERIELGPQLSKNIITEQNGEAVKPPDKLPSKNNDFCRTEVTVLNMEVETLRWQLSQTEANRQMHIALLKQIVAFLNRVKEHIEGQSNEPGLKKEGLPTRLLPRSFNVADLPRSRSVVHVNKNADYFLTTPKKISTKKISKSISNVNGFNDSNHIWSQSKLSLTPETDTSQKISEEMSRLITLAKTVLSTKLPDLACSCNERRTDTNTTNLIESHIISDGDSNNTRQYSNFTLDQIEEDTANLFAINTVGNGVCSHADGTNTLQEKDVSLKNHNNSASSLNSGFENALSDFKLVDKEEKISKGRADVTSSLNIKTTLEKTNDFSCSNFIEDESGFSSMSSFQEIGIPIISVIPPSPCKELGFMEGMPDLIEETEKWKTDTTELEKQTVKVFWV